MNRIPLEAKGQATFYFHWMKTPSGQIYGQVEDSDGTALNGLSGFWFNRLHSSVAGACNELFSRTGCNYSFNQTAVKIIAANKGE